MMEKSYFWITHLTKESAYFFFIFFPEVSSYFPDEYELWVMWLEEKMEGSRYHQDCI